MFWYVCFVGWFGEIWVRTHERAPEHQSQADRRDALLGELLPTDSTGTVIFEPIDSRLLTDLGRAHQEQWCSATTIDTHAL